MVKSTIISCLLLFSCFLQGQTLGGLSQYNFLKAPASPQLTGLGGINISQQTADIGMAFQNPSLLQANMHGQIQTVFHSFPGSIKNYNLLTAYHLNQYNTTLAMGVLFYDYGHSIQTDAGGSILGSFRPNDYAIGVMASRKYLTRWQYGAGLKFIHSSYGIYRSAAIALDIGLTYSDTANLLQLALVIQNMGVQLKAYETGSKGDLPFDIRVGVSKRLANAPIQFSINLHQLQNGNIRYADTTGNDPGSNAAVAKGFFDAALRHIIISTQLYVGDKIELSAGYNYLRRKELNIGNSGNGLNGFSIGVGVLLKKWAFRYALANYQNNIVTHQIGLTFSLNNFSKSVKS